jgi:hypothetical protein
MSGLMLSEAELMHIIDGLCIAHGKAGLDIWPDHLALADYLDEAIVKSITNLLNMTEGKPCLD